MYIYISKKSLRQSRHGGTEKKKTSSKSIRLQQVQKPPFFSSSRLSCGSRHDEKEARGGDVRATGRSPFPECVLGSQRWASVASVAVKSAIKDKKKEKRERKMKKDDVDVTHLSTAC